MPLPADDAATGASSARTGLVGGLEIPVLLQANDEGDIVFIKKFQKLAHAELTIGKECAHAVGREDVKACLHQADAFISAATAGLFLSTMNRMSGRARRVDGQHQQVDEVASRCNRASDAMVKATGRRDQSFIHTADNTFFGS